MTPKKAKAPTAHHSGDALGIAVRWAVNPRDIPLTTAEIQAIYMRRRTRAAPSLVPTLTALAFGRPT